MANPWLALPIILATVLGGFLLLWAHRWNATSKSRARLPKGSFGWPILGETLALARDPITFTSSHVIRYGKVFKSCFLLEPGIMGTTPEFFKFVSSSPSLFVGGWPENLMKTFGPQAFLFKDGPQHLSMKKLIQKPLLPETLRSRVSLLETIILENMASWEQKGTILGGEATGKIALDIGIWLLTGLRDISGTPEGREVQKSFEYMYKGVSAVPVNFPGTVYNKGLKARVALTQYFKDLIGKRRGQKNTQTDILGIILEAQVDPQLADEVKHLDDDMIVDTLVVVWLASFDAPATTLVWVLKFLNDNPDVFHRILVEQQEILKSKDASVKGPRLSWEDTRKMVYAQKFFQEVQRILSIAPYLPRRASQDVKYKDLLIPKGWAVRPIYSGIHHDPVIYPNPKHFDPDRFDARPKPYTYLPFSAGAHMCPGMELTKLTVLIFLHHLATTYRHESSGPDRGFQYRFFPRIIGGYPVNISKRM